MKHPSLSDIAPPPPSGAPRGLTRRSFLRGTGVMLALPLLEYFAPRGKAATQAKPVRRLVSICAPLGLHPEYFFPEKGGAAGGGLDGGKTGAAIGAGGGGTNAFIREAARRHFKPRTRTIGATASGASLGAGVGGAVGGRRSAAAGAIVGGTGGYLYRKHKRRIPRRY
jgi:hypothetical protein